MSPHESTQNKNESKRVQRVQMSPMVAYCFSNIFQHFDRNGKRQQLKVNRSPSNIENIASKPNKRHKKTLLCCQSGCVQENESKNAMSLQNESKCYESTKMSPDESTPNQNESNGLINESK